MNVNLHRMAAVLSVAVGVLAGALPALAATDMPATAQEKPASAEGSRVLPAAAHPYGYTLDDMARLTAAFNTSDRSGAPPNSPFQVLYVNTVTNGTSFTVARGKILYVPLFFSDNSAPILGDFPADAENRRQLLPYVYSQTEFGLVADEIIVDGVLVSLGARYVRGVQLSQPLPNGASQYIAAAAFVAPLSPGQHTVEIHTLATGDALRKPPYDVYFPDGVFESRTTYTVNVN